jgi:hypothetical protein
LGGNIPILQALFNVHWIKTMKDTQLVINDLAFCDVEFDQVRLDRVSGGAQKLTSPKIPSLMAAPIKPFIIYVAPDGTITCGYPTAPILPKPTNM